MAVKRDYYKVLGVAPTVSQDEIRKAYRLLSKKYHPDLNPHLKSIAEDKMKDIVESYNILNNPTKRKEYDRQPQFLVRRFKKTKRKEGPADQAKASKFKKEPSLLERILSPFVKKAEDTKSEGAVDYKQADVHFTLGLSMAEQEAFTESAKGEFRKAIKFDPEFPEAFYNLGLMCYKAGDFDEAKINFQKVLQYEKDDQMARTMLNLLQDG
jgi:DnaJ-class molecular chaperone